MERRSFSQYSRHHAELYNNSWTSGRLYSVCHVSRELSPFTVLVITYELANSNESRVQTGSKVNVLSDQWNV